MNIKLGLGSIAFVPIAGFFTTGTSAKIPIGAPVVAFLDEDLTIALAPAAPAQPIIVPVAAAPGAITAATAPSVTGIGDARAK